LIDYRLWREFFVSYRLPWGNLKSQDLVKISRRLVEKSQGFILTRSLVVEYLLLTSLPLPLAGE
jgi:hypothetical protein